MDETLQIPSIGELEQELLRERKRKHRGNHLVTALCVMATLIAAAVLVTSLWLPIVPVYGSAMEPGMASGDLLVAVQTGDYAPGDVIAFYHNNTIQVRRIIAGPGSVVQISPEGLVRVDGVVLAESYVTEPAQGQCDITLPYTVPDGCWFVLGDHRAESIDSRSSVMGCVSSDRIIGRVLFRVLPGEHFGVIPGN